MRLRWRAVPPTSIRLRLGAPVERRSVIEDQAANFSDDHAHGVEAYVEQFLINHPGLDPETVAADAQLAFVCLHDFRIRPTRCSRADTGAAGSRIAVHGPAAPCGQGVLMMLT